MSHCVNQSRFGQGQSRFRAHSSPSPTKEHDMLVLALALRNRPLDAKQPPRLLLSYQLRVNQVVRSFARNTRRGCCMRGNGLGRRLTTRGSYRPGRCGLRSRARSSNSGLYPSSHATISMPRLTRAHHRRSRTSADLKLNCSSRDSLISEASTITVRMRL